MKVSKFSPRPTALFSLVLLLVVSAFGLVPTLRAQSFSSLERDRAKIMLSSIKSEIKKNYYDPNYHGVDLEARFKTAEERLKQATSMGQAFGIIAQAVLDLNDSHTIFIPPQRAVTVDYGWRMQMIGDKCYVVAIKPGSDAESKLKLGDEVLAVDNFQPTRASLWKMDYFYNALRPQSGMHLAVKSPDGQAREVDVMAKIKQGKRLLDLTLNTNANDLMDMIRDSENNAPLREHRTITFGENKDLFIWKMPHFDDAELIDRVMGKAKNSKALIIDLRNNGGGLEEGLLRLIGYFFDKDFKVGDIKRRKETKPLMAKTRGGDVYKGKVIVLVDSESGSSSEIFSRVIQMEKRGVVIGDKTAGAVMRGSVFPLQTGTDTIIPYAVQVTDADLVMTDGNSLEHVGVTPDELRLPTAQEMAAHQDPVLAYAVSLAGAKISPEQAGKLFPVLWRK